MQCLTATLPSQKLFAYIRLQLYPLSTGGQLSQSQCQPRTFLKNISAAGTSPYIAGFETAGEAFLAQFCFAIVLIALSRPVGIIHDSFSGKKTQK